MLQLLDKTIIDLTSVKAKESSRLRMNYNFHPLLDDKVQRFINCMEPGTKVEIHHHPVDEMLIVIRGAIKAILVDDEKNIIDTQVIRPADGVNTSTSSVQALRSSPRPYGASTSLGLAPR